MKQGNNIGTFQGGPAVLPTALEGHLKRVVTQCHAGFFPFSNILLLPISPQWINLDQIKNLTKIGKLCVRDLKYKTWKEK